MCFLHVPSVRKAAQTFAFAAVSIATGAAASAPPAAAGGSLPMRVGPQLLVGEQYDISGGITQAVAFPIVGGILRSPEDKRYQASSSILTTGNRGQFLSSNGSEIDTRSIKNGSVLSRLAFQPINPNEFPTATELHVDSAGRTFVSFFYQYRNVPHLGIAMYAPGARGNQRPYAILPIPSSAGISTGIATFGNEVFVSNGADAVDVFAPIEHPHRVGQIRGFRSPAGIGFDRHGELYVCNAGDGTVIALAPTERGTVKPDRVISVANHPLCRLRGQFFNNGNEMAVSGDAIFVTADGAQEVYELNASIPGPQTPMASNFLGRNGNPWQGVDLAVGS